MKSYLSFAAVMLTASIVFASPADPTKSAAEALVKQGCKIERETARFIAVSCPGQPTTRIMRMPQQRKTP